MRPLQGLAALALITLALGMPGVWEKQVQQGIEVLPNEASAADEDAWDETELSAVAGAAKCALIVKGTLRQAAKPCATKCIVSETKDKAGVLKIDSMCDHDAGNACDDPGLIFQKSGEYPAIKTDKCVTYPDGLKVTCNMNWDGTKKNLNDLDCSSAKNAAPTPAPASAPAPAPAPAPILAPSHKAKDVAASASCYLIQNGKKTGEKNKCQKGVDACFSISLNNKVSSSCDNSNACQDPGKWIGQPKKFPALKKGQCVALGESGVHAYCSDDNTNLVHAGKIPVPCTGNSGGEHGDATSCALVASGNIRVKAGPCSTKCITSEKDGVINSMCDMENVCQNPGKAMAEKGKGAPKFPALAAGACNTYPNGMKIYCSSKWDGKETKISVQCPAAPSGPSLKVHKGGASSLQAAATTVLGAVLLGLWAHRL